MMFTVFHLENRPNEPYGSILTAAVRLVPRAFVLSRLVALKLALTVARPDVQTSRQKCTETAKTWNAVSRLMGLWVMEMADRVRANATVIMMAVASQTIAAQRTWTAARLSRRLLPTLMQKVAWRSRLRPRQGLNQMKT
jgi:hypothetical protein